MRTIIRIVLILDSPITTLYNQDGCFDMACLSFVCIAKLEKYILGQRHNLFSCELKNIRPQLYSAAEYCEKSYLHSEQKQVVLDNLKDYAVRALVNTVDHLGTVAYKLTDLLEQQTLEISTTGLHMYVCLQKNSVVLTPLIINIYIYIYVFRFMQLLTCQTYTDREALRQ
ncbi:putative ABI family protein [Helianthus debilis subsp. tardiflorus]